jgi:hypothetical protein
VAHRLKILITLKKVQKLSFFDYRFRYFLIVDKIFFN